jgi:hypothetical protein
MAKTNYIAKLDGAVIGTRSSASARTYTHAVIIQHDEAWYRERAHSTKYAAEHNTKENFKYYSEMAARGVAGEQAEWKYMSLEEVTERVANAERIVAMGYDVWVEERRLENIASHEASMARGGFKPAVVCWNGRPDLAQKEAAKYQQNASVANVWVVAAEPVAKLPKIAGERKHAAYGPHSD